MPSVVICCSVRRNDWTKRFYDPIGMYGKVYEWRMETANNIWFSIPRDGGYCFQLLYSVQSNDHNDHKHNQSHRNMSIGFGFPAASKTCEKYTRDPSNTTNVVKSETRDPYCLFQWCSNRYAPMRDWTRVELVALYVMCVQFMNKWAR